MGSLSPRKKAALNLETLEDRTVMSSIGLNVGLQIQPLINISLSTILPIQAFHKELNLAINVSQENQPDSNSGNQNGSSAGLNVTSPTVVSPNPTQVNLAIETSSRPITNNSPPVVSPVVKISNGDLNSGNTQTIPGRTFTNNNSVNSGASQPQASDNLSAIPANSSLAGQSLVQLSPMEPFTMVGQSGPWLSNIANKVPQRQNPVDQEFLERPAAIDPMDILIDNEPSPHNFSPPPSNMELPGESPAPLEEIPQGADLLTHVAPGENPNLELAIQQFISQINDVGHDLTMSLAQQGWFPWVLEATLIGAAAMEISRRQCQRRSRRALGLAGASESLRWIPGMPGSLSFEDA